jgi:hypothetical protein
MTEERMIRVKQAETAEDRPIGLHWEMDMWEYRWSELEPAPMRYTIEYGDGDEEWFYAKDEFQKDLLAFALATEHYWFYDRKEISDMFEKGTISVREKTHDRTAKDNAI